MAAGPPQVADHVHHHTGAFLIAAVAAPLVAPYGLNEGELSNRLLPPLFFGGTTDFVLGTDALGRDMLSRIIYGARITALVAGVALIVGGAFERPWGLSPAILGAGSTRS